MDGPDLALLLDAQHIVRTAGFLRRTAVMGERLALLQPAPVVVAHATAGRWYPRPRRSWGIRKVHLAEAYVYHVVILVRNEGLSQLDACIMR